MRDFLFEGELGSSKSIFNRALIISSFHSSIEVLGQSSSDDVDLMRKAIRSLGQTNEFQCGSAGTVLRFLALRLAREKGIFRLKGSSRLMGRLMLQLQQTLSQLGSESRLLDDETLELDCDGWRPRGDGLWIPSGESSQFASAVLLSAWGLKAPIHFVRSGELVSDSYFQMTLDMVRNFGMVVDIFDQEVSIAADQKPKATSYQVECDVSSAFVIAALAAVAGRCHIHNFPRCPIQPDAIFISHFIRMGVPVQQDEEGLVVGKCEKFKAIEVDLNSSPDLFPVLACLLAKADSASQFRGHSHLIHKESNRLEKVIELTEAMGAKWVEKADGSLEILPFPKLHSNLISFDADEDHRLVMAAAVAQAMGFQVKVTGADCISKSFKGFEQIWAVC